MNPKTSHKIIAAGGMAAVIAIGVAVFFLRSAPVAPIVSAAEPAAPAAEAPAAVPPVAAEAPFAPAPVAEIPAASAQNDPVSHARPDRAIPPVADAKASRHSQAASATSDGNVISPTVARTETLPMPTRKPAVTDRVEVVAAGGDLDKAPMSISALTGTPDAGASAPIVASDSNITTAVKSAIASEGLATDSAIAVSTTDGVVALSGSVPSQSAIDQVKDVAAKVKDVKSVDTSGLILASL